MLFHKTFLITLAATLALAAPFEVRDDPFFSPSQTWQYNVANSSITPTSTGLVSKSPGNGGQDITALLTFTYPPEVEGLKCQFDFSLGSESTVSGSGKIDVFTSIRPVTSNSTFSWSRGNQRDVHLGRLTASPGISATWDATYNEYLTEKTDCKAPGTVEGFELVGVYHEDLISWDASTSGLRIVYTS